MAATDLVKAKISFYANTDPNNPIPIHQGAIAHADHPVVKAHPDEWEPLTIDFKVEPAKKATGK